MLARSREEAVPSAGCGRVGLAHLCLVAAADVPGCRAQGLVRAAAGRMEPDSLGTCSSGRSSSPVALVCHVATGLPLTTQSSGKEGAVGALLQASRTREGPHGAGWQGPPWSRTQRPEGPARAAQARRWLGEDRAPASLRPACPDRASRSTQARHHSGHPKCPVSLPAPRPCPSLQPGVAPLGRGRDSR